MVDIDAAHSQHSIRIARYSGQHSIELFDKQSAIRQTGMVIIVSQMACMLFIASAFTNILCDQNAAHWAAD